MSVYWAWCAKCEEMRTVLAGEECLCGTWQCHECKSENHGSRDSSAKGHDPTCGEIPRCPDCFRGLYGVDDHCDYCDDGHCSTTDR